MKVIYFIFIIFLIACSSIEVKIETPLSFVEGTLKNHQVVISLPEFEHGFPFIEEDSITYINLFLINDSVIQVNDSLFELEGFYNQNIYRAMMKNEQDSSSFNPKSIKLLKYIKSNIENKPYELMLFIDTNTHFGLIKNLYWELFKLPQTQNGKINLIDKNNNFIAVIQSKHKEMVGVICGMIDFLHIMINEDGLLLIDSEWDKNIEDITNKVIDFYSNPELGYRINRFDRVTEKEIRTNLAILNNYLLENKSFKVKSIIQKRIENWQRSYKIWKTIGDYKTLKKPNFISIQGSDNAKTTHYFEVLDETNKALLELRNKLSIEKFKIEYLQLNLSIKKESEYKTAIDEIYPLIINPLEVYPKTPPPPPPNIK